MIKYMNMKTSAMMLATSIVMCFAAVAAPIKSMLSYRNNSINNEDDVLPYDAEVEYLESDGSQCIYTGLHPVAGLGFNIEFTVSPNVNKWARYFPFGWYNDWYSTESARRTYTVVMNLKGNPVSIGFAVSNGRQTYNRTEILGSPALGQFVTASFDALENSFYYNGQIVSNPDALTYETEPRSVNSLPLFGRLDNNIFTGSAVRISYVKFNYYGQLIRDYIAVRFMNEDGEVEGGMYDVVSRQIFRNQGSGSFIVGPDKEVQE